jgi:hypothetical protein
MTKTFYVKGVKMRTSSQRRYVVVAGREHAAEGRQWDYRTESYVPRHFAAIAPSIVRRSDSFEVARKAASAQRVAGGYAVVIDTTTGEEV